MYVILAALADNSAFSMSSSSVRRSIDLKERFLNMSLTMNQGELSALLDQMGTTSIAANKTSTTVIGTTLVESK